MQNAEKIEKVYNLLADDCSKQTYADIINFKISGKIDYLESSTSCRRQTYQQIINPTDHEVYVDLGAYNGDTVTEFLDVLASKYGSDEQDKEIYNSIHAFEPNPFNFKRLEKNMGNKKINLYNAAASGDNGVILFEKGKGRMTKTVLEKNNNTIEVKSYAVDDIIEEPATLIKLDVEGAEFQAILGAKRHIENGAKIICALYHRNEDMFSLPLLIHEINPNLKLYIRHHLYIPAWETNLYAV